MRPGILAASIVALTALLFRPPPAETQDVAVTAVLWTPPADLAVRDLLHGPGGEAAAPRGPMRLVHGETGGTAPKFRLRDAGGRVWIAKLGSEAKPETAASRLLWAVGFAADPGYFVPEMVVDDLPATPSSGPGVVRDAHFERLRDPGQHAHAWRWRSNPFVGTQAFDGLRVMMALVNNWDLKDDNNVVYRDAEQGRAVAIYEVGDLGASFGTTGYVWPESAAKGNLVAFRRSGFIRVLTPLAVDFETPASPPLPYLFDLPNFVRRMRMRSICRGIPRAHARWMGGLLAQLSIAQLGDAFRAAGFTPAEVDGYVAVMRARIVRLASL